MLRLVADAAELSDSDVVLEVGGGLGVLSEHLAPRVRHLHVVEVDRSLEPPLRDAIGPFDNVDLHFADAVELDMAALRPPPDKVVANLPYGVAATVILKSIEELPDARLWIAMVQHEVGRRLAAAPGSKVYGATSVLAQLSCEVKMLRRISRNVFHPVPNVESGLVRLAARRPAAGSRARRPRARRVRAPPQDAARIAGARRLRPRASKGRTGRGRAPAGCARRAAVSRRLPQARGDTERVIRERAPAKVNLLLHVGAPRADGLHELCSLFASIDLADELTVEPADADEVRCAGVEGPNLALAAVERFRAEAAPDLPPLRVTIDKRIPVAAGLGGGSADAAAVLRAANQLADEPLDAAGLRALGASLGADVPSQVEPRHALVTGAGEVVEPVELPPMTLLLVPDESGLSTAEVYAQADALGTTRAELDPERVRELAGRPLAELANSLENDLEGAAVSLRPELTARMDALRDAGALTARVTGSGPDRLRRLSRGRGARRRRRDSNGARVTAHLTTKRIVAVVVSWLPRSPSTRAASSPRSPTSRR